MTQFSVSESGLFSAGSYDEQSQTLTVTFRDSGETYVVRGVAKSLGERFMAQGRGEKIAEKQKQEPPK